MCGHIIHEEESKLVRWGVTQTKASSQNSKGGLHKELLKDLHNYLHKVLNNYLHNFWGVKAKNSEWGKNCTNGSYKITKHDQSTSGNHPKTKEAH